MESYSYSGSSFAHAYILEQPLLNYHCFHFIVTLLYIAICLQVGHFRNQSQSIFFNDHLCHHK